ncbi:MAG: hypothetical protein M3R70_05300 [Actinomycetota bacterium]|nr:hypothetical protein [Actinomycetota bacterium]
MIDDRRGRHRRLRQGKRLTDGTVVVLDYDASGCVVRETHYTPDKAWVRKVVERGSDQRRTPDSAQPNGEPRRWLTARLI